MTLKNVDVLIIGQGLMGSLIAWECLRNNLKIAVLDEGHIRSASKAAAGILEPITGKRWVKSWKAETVIPFAVGYYQQLEKELGISCWRPHPIWRCFQGEEDRRIWHKKRVDPDYAAFCKRELTPGDIPPEIQATLGGIEQTQGGMLRMIPLITGLRDYLRQKDVLIEEVYVPEELTPSAAALQWKTIAAKEVIFCEGYSAAGSPLWNWLPFRNAKGEALTLTIKGLPPRIYSKGGWLVPLGGDHWTFGATYEWEDLTQRPTQSGYAKLQTMLQTLLPNTPFRITGLQTGVRAILPDAKPVLGEHPRHPHRWIANALGSKGAMLAPYCAQQLIAHLTQNTPLDPELSLDRF